MSVGHIFKDELTYTYIHSVYDHNGTLYTVAGDYLSGVRIKYSILHSICPWSVYTCHRLCFEYLRPEGASSCVVIYKYLRTTNLLLGIGVFKRSYSVDFLNYP